MRVWFGMLLGVFFYFCVFESGDDGWLDGWILD